jgi:hypothetical protein
MKRTTANSRQSKLRNPGKKPISDREFETRKRALHALARMRKDNLSLVSASREEGTTPATVKRHFRAALSRTKRGKWVVTKNDRYVRILRLPDVHGPTTVKAKGYSEAQLASAYVASLTRWARTEKAYELASFHGKKVGGFELITATRTLRALRDAGLLQLDSLYAALKDTV